MKILLIGGGGREHTIAWKLKQSSISTDLFTSPGNSGTAEIGKNVELNSHRQIKDFIEKNEIDILIMGPEKPLVEGLIDYLKGSLSQKCILFGPHKSGAMLEGSKDFAKEFMNRYNIPTAAYKSFTKESLSEAIDFIQELNTPIVLKADGLAGGKGVLIHDDKSEAIHDLKEMLGGKFGEASEKVVIEEFLDGIEFSVFIITDGKEYKLLPVAKDYKRIGEGGTGLNTGGMGTVSPVPFVTDEILHKVETQIIKPTIKGIQEEGLSYKGFLFFGLMLVDNNPYVIEYNCRMGDPEAQVVLPRAQFDLIRAIQATEEGNLSSIGITEDKKTVISTILASEGYPVDYKKGFEIKGIKESDALIFQAGVRKEKSKHLTDGGRVLAVTASGENLSQAQENCRAAVDMIDFKGKTYRSDIGNDLL